MANVVERLMEAQRRPTTLLDYSDYVTISTVKVTGINSIIYLVSILG